MSHLFLARLVEASIPVLGGIWATLVGYRKVGKKPGEDLRYDQWHANFGRWGRTLGPLMIVGGIISTCIVIVRELGERGVL